MKLSVLDTFNLRNGFSAKDAVDDSVKSICHVEQLGYFRYWVSEHHNTSLTASSAPEILIGYLASKTSKIRVGSGCILLPYYSSLKVAECFKQLELLYPNRIDLGVGRASGCDELTSYFLSQSRNSELASYHEKIYDLKHFLDQTHISESVKSKIKVVPRIPKSPPIWILGSSINSAKLALQLGVNFSYAHFLNPASTGEVLTFLNNYSTNISDQKFSYSLAIRIICSDNKTQLRQMLHYFDWYIVRSGSKQKSDGVYRANYNYRYNDREKAEIHLARENTLIGAPHEIRLKLSSLVDFSKITELIISMCVCSLDQKLSTYSLLAQEFNLKENEL